MIPKRIFRIWLNDTEPVPALPESYVTPPLALAGYEQVMVTLDNVMNWTHSEFVKEAILTKQWVQAADYLRLELLYFEGGLYLDMDVEVIKPFDDLLNYRFFAGWEEEVLDFFSQEQLVGNAVLGSERGFPLLREVMYELEHAPDTTLGLTRSLLFSRVVQSHSDEVNILPAVTFYPYHHTQIYDPSCVTPETYTIHYWSKRWI